MSMSEKCVELRLPAEESMMLIIRLTSSGVLMRAGLPLDDVDDVKMAVEEAANCLVRFSNCENFNVLFSIDKKELRVVLSGDCCQSSDFPQTQDELGTIRYILESMVDEVKLSGRDSGLTRIELMKRLPE